MEVATAAVDPADDDELLAGHSAHGEAFNEGPRQAAELIAGMGNIDFPSSAKDEQTQAFINQGVAALHGFWYLEAERAFRQAAHLQPDLAIAYWGMAQANANNHKRATEFIGRASELRDGATKREQLYIDAYAKYLKRPDKAETGEQKKKRQQQYVTDLEQLLNEFPDDIDARALLAAVPEPSLEQRLDLDHLEVVEAHAGPGSGLETGELPVLRAGQHGGVTGQRGGPG